MLLGLISITFSLVLAIWTLLKKTGNRFVIGIAVMILFFPLEFLTVSFPGAFISKVSPFAIYTFFVFSGYICLRLYFRKKVPISLIYSTNILYALAILFFTILSNGYVGLGTIFDNYLAPVMALYIVSNERHRISNASRKRVLTLISIAAIYGVIEFILGKNILLEFVFSQMEWISTQWNSSFHRSTSTMGHPLIGATIYIMALALLEKSNKKYWLYTSIFILGVLSTGSRAGIGLAIIAILSKHMSLRLSARDAIGLSAMFFVAFLGLIGGLFDQVLSRFMNGEGSTAVRTALFEFIPGIIRDNLFGHGVGASGAYAGDIGFYNAIEIPWIALIIELGVVGLIASLILATANLLHYKLWQSNTILLGSTFVMISSYNSISVHSPIITLVVVVLFIPTMKLSEKKQHLNGINTHKALT